MANGSFLTAGSGCGMDSRNSAWLRWLKRRRGTVIAPPALQPRTPADCPPASPSDCALLAVACAVPGTTGIISFALLLIARGRIAFAASGSVAPSAVSATAGRANGLLQIRLLLFR